MLSNNDVNRLGKNISALRKAYGDSQEKLADYLHTKRHTISQYENGKRIPDDEIKCAIAKRYIVSVQMLMFSDLSGYDLKFNIENTNEICFQFPIITSDKALANSNFYEAYTHHKKLYDFFMKFPKLIKEISLDNLEILSEYMEIFGKLPDYLEAYSKSYKNDDIKIESAVNYIAMYHFISAFKQFPEMIKTALINKVEQLSSNINGMIDEVSVMPENTIQESLSRCCPIFNNTFDDQKYNKLLDDMMNTIRKNPEYSDLEQYYEALEYIDNIIDNNTDLATNIRTGYDNLKHIAKRGNSYALRYLVSSPDPIGNKEYSK